MSHSRLQRTTGSVKRYPKAQLLNKFFRKESRYKYLNLGWYFNLKSEAERETNDKTGLTTPGWDCQLVSHRSCFYYWWTIYMLLSQWNLEAWTGRVSDFGEIPGRPHSTGSTGYLLLHSLVIWFCLAETLHCYQNVLIFGNGKFHCETKPLKL
jgi:hypothetical protein